jgi:hypothetical protein
MVRSKIVLGLLLAVGSVTTVLADTTSLQSILTNANGAQTTDFTGYNIGGFNTVSGLGTLTFVYNPGPGVYFFDVFFDHQLSLPFFNEFGTVLGAPAAGQSYEIGDSFASSIYTDVQAGGALSNTNKLPGTTSNFNNACVGAACNGDFAAALGFGFTLAAGQKELITLNVSHVDPGSGLRLEDTHPQDPANPNTGGNLFISGSATVCTLDQCVGPPPTPEPASAVLFGSGLAILLIAFRRRLAVKL